MPTPHNLTRLALALTAALAAHGTAHAATRTWSGASGANWTATSSWSTAVVPVNGDDVVLGTASKTAVVSFNGAYSGVGLNSMVLDYGSTFNQSLSTSALVATSEYIGGAGTAASTYNQSGGSNVAGLLRIESNNSGTPNAYTISGGTLTVSKEFDLGYLNAGSASFTQLGGSVALGGTILLGLNTSATGTYLMKGGTFSASGNVGVGVIGKGSMVQSGGTSTMNSLMVSYISTSPAGGTGAYVLNSNDGPASLNVGTEWIGVPTSSGGSFVQSGNVSHVVGGALFIGAVGSFSLAGGTLSAFSMSIAGGGSFSMSGGSVSAPVTNNGTLNYSAGSFLGSLVNGATGTLNLTSPLVAGGTVTNQGLVTLASGAGLGGATLDNQNTITLAGGTLAGSVISNNGSIGGYGSFSGASTLQNYGQLTQGAGNLVFSNTGANVNYGNIALATGRQLQLANGAGLHNAGSLNLNGALITGEGSLNNGDFGTLAGPGTVSALSFDNSGNIVPGAGTLYITSSWTNDGVVQLSGPLSTITGGQITNRLGTIQGAGTVGAFIVSNSGTIEAIGGTLVLSGGIVNTATPDGQGGQNYGTLAAGAGAKLLLTRGGNNTAGGTIALSGGTLDLGNFTLPNAGQLTGWGTVRTGGIDNSGQVLLSGGPSAVYGPVTGQSGSLTALSGNGTATFYGKVDIDTGAELRVSAGSVATFFGAVAQRTGSIFSGTGTKFYEGGLSVGASPGLGSDAGDVNFGVDNFYLAEIGGTTACTLDCASNEALKNASFDKYIVAGHLGLGGTLKLTSWNGFVAHVGQRFDLLDWGSESGSFAAIDTSGLLLAPGSVLDTSQLYVDGSLSVVAVPEPRTSLMWLAGLAVAGGLARRRVQRN